MIYNRHVYLNRIKKIALRLEDIISEVIFVGGAVVALYADDPAQNEVRPTEDVDLVVEISSYSSFSRFEEKLRDLGFRNDLESRVMTRYKLDELIVDFMPTDTSVLGFTNRWYKEGAKKSFLYSIADNVQIRLMPFSYFIASKLEAHFSRNAGDLRSSKDFEDIIYCFDNRLSPEKDLKEGSVELLDYLRQNFKSLFRIARLMKGFLVTLKEAAHRQGHAGLKVSGLIL